MRSKSAGFSCLLAVAILSVQAGRSDATVETSVNSSGRAVLWREPADIGTRDLYYGPGGEKDQPEGPFTFIEEDLNGTNPKYVVRDRNKVKWTVKLGMEARPETVASRLVWAVGYFTNEDYFIDDLRIEGMPARVKRGAKLIGPGGEVHAVRLKRHMGDEKTEQNWQWRNDPFTGTRELNGLKVMMALINNWDLKDENNKVYGDKDSGQEEYVVSDLGASFGTNGLSYPFSHSKGDLTSYERSKFIAKITPEYVDFKTPGRPSIMYVGRPRSFIRRTRLDDLLHHIPRDDVRWIAHVLSGLSNDQIRDAFRAAGYTQPEIDAFSNVVEQRIARLNNL